MSNPLKKRGDVWIVDMYINGVRRKRSTGERDRSQALLKMPDIMKDMLEEDSATPLADITLSEGFQKLTVAEDRENDRYYDGWKYRMDECISYLGEDTLIRDITEDKLRLLRAHLQAQPGKGKGLSSPATVNRKLADLKHLLMVAYSSWGVLKVPPKVKLLKTADQRRRALTDDEIGTLLETTSEDYRVVWQFLIETGLRTAEFLSMRWENIQIESKRLHIFPSDWMEVKTKKARMILLTDDMVRELKSQKKDGQERPFDHITRWTMRGEWRKIKKAMGLEWDNHFVPYSLRHTCATRLVAQGVPIKAVQKWMGHSNLTTTMIYIDESLTDLEGCVKAVSVSDLRTSEVANG